MLGLRERPESEPRWLEQEGRLGGQGAGDSEMGLWNVQCDMDKSKVAVLGGCDHAACKQGREALNHADSTRRCPTLWHVKITWLLSASSMQAPY